MIGIFLYLKLFCSNITSKHIVFNDADDDSNNVYRKCRKKNNGKWNKSITYGNENKKYRFTFRFTSINMNISLKSYYAYSSFEIYYYKESAYIVNNNFGK